MDSKYILPQSSTGNYSTLLAILVLLFSLTCTTFLSAQGLTPQKFTTLEDLLKDNKLNELILAAEALKPGNAESLALRTLLFKAYLYSDYRVKATEELDFIESRVKNDETVYLRALEAIHTNRINSTSTSAEIEHIITLLSTIKDRRYTPPYLLRANLYTFKKQFNIAREELNTYRSLEGETSEWYFNYGKFLLRHYAHSGPTTMAKKAIRNHIDRYASAYPANHEQMYLRAEYYATMEQFDYALQYIDKAIYLSFSRAEYLNNKLYYLYRSQQFKQLVDVIANMPMNSGSKASAVHYQWVRSFINFINFKDSQKLFTLKNPNALPMVIEPLEKILSINPEHEAVRFFLEEILLANTDQRDPVRNPYGEYRYLRAQVSFERARIDESQFELERMIALVPFNKTYRMVYLEYLRFHKLNELYHLEAQNYKTLFTNIPQNERIRFQMAEQQLQENLSTRYRIKDLLTSPEITGLIVYNQRNYKDSWTQPYLEAIVARMLQTSQTHVPLVDWSISSVQDLRNRPPHDYEVHFDINDQNSILTINFKVLDPARITIFNETHSFYGKDRYNKMLTKWKVLSFQIFPKLGRVSAVVDRQAMVSLGKTHGAKMGDRVQLIKNGQVSGEFNLARVDNYYSLITIDKIFTLSKTEIGDQVILLPATDVAGN